MASCPKCGKIKIRKRPDGTRRCLRCGCINMLRYRHGELRCAHPQEPAPAAMTAADTLARHQ